jgi:hypothetical protein
MEQCTRNRTDPDQIGVLYFKFSSRYIIAA